MAGWLAKERIVAQPGFSRWLVPPAALAIHLSIGMAYGLSVFWLPLSRAIGITAPAAGDWKVSTLGWTFSLGIVFLGLSAAVFGRWLEREGPRKAGVVAAFCWGGGFAIGALAVHLHNIWLLYLGLGIIGGCGLGLGYISPVSTLIKWFPDRRGMATGMAIMGFGGGAMIGAPLANILMNLYRSDGSVGVWQTFVTMAAIYFVFMLGGAFGYRLPPAGWRPEGWMPKKAKPLIATKHVHLSHAHKVRQFWLIWGVLCLNVSAGIGVIGMASPMLQEIFGGRLIGRPDVPFTALDATQAATVAGYGAGFTGLLSLFNIGGRFFWASLSDYIGRKATYATFFLLGIAMYTMAPWFAHAGSKGLFVLAVCIILSMYGGGFATIPAYLADIFGTQFVGAIHGRVLTAWSMAGVLGPVLVNYIRQFQIDRGVAKADAYNLTMYVMTGLLLLGFLCNAAIRRVGEESYMTPDELEAEQRLLRRTAAAGPGRA